MTDLTISALNARIVFLEDRLQDLLSTHMHVRKAARDVCYEARNDTAVWIIMEPVITKLELLLAYPEPEPE